MKISHVLKLINQFYKSLLNPENYGAKMRGKLFIEMCQAELVYFYFQYLSS